MKLSVSLVSGVIFAAVAVLHVLRLFYGWAAQIGGWDVPMWFSGVGLVVAALLALWNFSHCHKYHA
ncbi:hypothetical protein HYW83_05595 [Candidatus Peregrinibacteria bacterium]|nr:hypothetical protein [Candidatus Peregrinibacteria bacterium]